MGESRSTTTRRRGRSLLAFAFAGALVALMAVSAVLSAPTAHAASTDLLILGDTLCCGNSTSSPEILAAQNLGLTYTVVNGATWDSMTAAQFDSYKAVVLADPDCSDISHAQAAINNNTVWEPAINGPVVVIGTDPTFHDFAGIPGAFHLIQDGISFAASGSGTTGAYVDLSCYYDNGLSNQAVTLLNGFVSGGFTVSSEGTPAVGPCGSPVHIVSSSAALLGLSDSDLSNWECSVHEGFNTIPSGWNVLAIDTAGQPIYTAPDGSTGIPYIVARGTTFSCANSDTDAPTITGSAITDVNGKRALQITVSDTNPSTGPATGLSNILAYGTNLQVINGSGAVLGPISAPTTFATIPGFLPTASTSYTFVAEKVASGSGASLTVQAIDQCGNVADPGFHLKGNGLHGHKSADRKSVVIDSDANS